MADSGGEIDLVKLASLSEPGKGFVRHFQFTNYSSTLALSLRGVLHTVLLGMPDIHN